MLKPDNYFRQFTYLLLFLLCGTGSLLHAQSPDFQWSQLTIEDGLSQSSVMSITQDQEGFLWIGTQDGLNRFDGRTFEVYKNIPFDSTSLADNFITALLSDRSNRLWVASGDGHLNLFVPGERRFIRFQPDPSHPGVPIMQLYEDRHGNVWGSTRYSFFLLETRPENEKQLSARVYQLPEKEGSTMFVRTFHHDSSDRLLLGTNHGLIALPYLSDSAVDTSQLNRPATEALLISPFFSAIHSIETDAEGRLWIMDRKGLWHSTEDKFISVNTQLKSSKKSWQIGKLLCVRTGDLLMVNTNGLYRLPFEKDEYSQKWEQLKLDHTITGQVTRIGQLACWEDRLHEGLLWLGTDINGLLKIHPRQSFFITDPMQQMVAEHRLAPVVWEMITDTSGHLWAKMNDGLIRKNPETGSSRFWKNLEWPSGKLMPPILIRSWAFDEQQRLWLGTDQGLVEVTDTTGKHILVKPHRSKNKMPGHVDQIIRAGREFWLINAYQLRRFDPESRQVLQSIEIDYSSSDPPRRRISSGVFDQDGNLWMGSNHGLLMLPDLTRSENISPTIYLHDPQDRNSLISNNINSVVADREGRIWAGTINGLSLFQPSGESGNFRSWTEADGLANNLVYGILEEAEGAHLWLSTNNGLSRFHKQQNHFNNYHRSDGLQSNEFNGGSFHRSAEGELFFGGIKGFTRFFPGQIRQQQHSPPVYFSSLTTNNGRLIDLSHQQSAQPLQFSHRENSISVRFTGLDYLQPDGIRYYYDLEGSGAKNVAVGESRELYFSNLAPGQYRLSVRAANKDGMLNNEAASLQFEIATPFWKSVWFYVLSVFLLLLIAALSFYFVYRIKINRVREIEKVRSIAAQDFHDELGSKLSIISLYSELSRNGFETRDADTPTYLQKVLDTSNSLYSSMKDLIWTMSPEKDSLLDLFIHLKDFGEELFNHSNIIFQSEGINHQLEERSLPMDYKRHVMLIGKEALNNCLKHAHCQQVELKVALHKSTLMMEIKDNGKGMNGSTNGKGDGLKNMNSRANKINSKLLIYSDTDGTSVKLICPMALTN